MSTTPDFREDFSPVFGFLLICLAAALLGTVGFANSFMTGGGTAIDPALSGLVRSVMGAAFLLAISLVTPASSSRQGEVPIAALLVFGIAGTIFQISLFTAFTEVG